MISGPENLNERLAGDKGGEERQCGGLTREGEIQVWLDPASIARFPNVYPWHKITFMPFRLKLCQIWL